MYILDLNLPIAKVWHQRVRKASTEMWGEAQEEEAKPRAREEWLEALRDLGQELPTQPPSLSWAPKEEGRSVRIRSPWPLVTDRASTKWKGRGWDPISFLLSRASGRRHPYSHPTPIVLTSQFPQPSAQDQLYNFWGPIQPENVGPFYKSWCGGNS